jgi:hypothetical protein
MWDAIAKILTNANAALVLLFLTMFVLIFIILVKTGLVQIKTDKIRVGNDSAKERDIIRQQVEWSHSYIMGLKSALEIDEGKYSGYLTRYILESCSSEVSKWICFNHINLDSEYISIKQETIRSIILRTDDIDAKYKSKEFLKRVDKHVEELIRKLVTIRQMYK